MTEEPFYVFSIRSEWHGRVERPAAIGAKFVNMLDALSRIDPIFSDWLVAGFPNPSSGDHETDTLNMKAIPLASARSRIAEIVENYVVRNDAYEPDPDGGYKAFATTNELDGPRVAGVSVDAGGKYDGSIVFRFGELLVPPDLRLVNYSLYKAALLAIVRLQMVWDNLRCLGTEALAHWG